MPTTPAFGLPGNSQRGRRKAVKFSGGSFQCFRSKLQVLFDFTSHIARTSECWLVPLGPLPHFIPHITSLFLTCQSKALWYISLPLHAADGTCMAFHLHPVHQAYTILVRRHVVVSVDFEEVGVSEKWAVNLACSSYFHTCYMLPIKWWFWDIPISPSFKYGQGIVNSSCQISLWIPALQFLLGGVLHHVRLHFLAVVETRSDQKNHDLWHKLSEYLTQNPTPEKKHVICDNSTKSTARCLQDVRRQTQMFGWVKSACWSWNRPQPACFRVWGSWILAPCTATKCVSVYRYHRITMFWVEQDVSSKLKIYFQHILNKFSISLSSMRKRGQTPKNGGIPTTLGNDPEVRPTKARCHCSPCVWAFTNPKALGHLQIMWCYFDYSLSNWPIIKYHSTHISCNTLGFNSTIHQLDHGVYWFINWMPLDQF